MEAERRELRGPGAQAPGALWPSARGRRADGRQQGRGVPDREGRVGETGRVPAVRVGGFRGGAEEKLVGRGQELVRLEVDLPARVPGYVPQPRPAGLDERLPPPAS